MNVECLITNFQRRGSPLIRYEVKKYLDICMYVKVFFTFFSKLYAELRGLSKINMMDMSDGFHLTPALTLTTQW